MKVLGIIPAKGTSRGVPEKNKRPLLGMSLVERTFRVARSAGVLDRMILSTDDPAIAADAQRVGLEVPFLRPDAIARDETPMIDVVLHALEALASDGYAPDGVLLLQPTSPLRTAAHIRDALARLDGYDAVCSVTPLPKDLCPHYLVRVGEDGLMSFFMPDGARYTRRQDVPQAYRRDGTIFLTRTSVLRAARSFYGERCAALVLRPDEILNIDEPADWAEAERRLGQDGAGRLAP